MTHMNMQDFELFFRCGKEVVDIYRGMSASLPKGQQRDDAEKRLGEAERALRASEVQLAKGLGYHLCQCTFPPQIMLRTGRHPVHGDEIFKCGACGNQEPSEHDFAKKTMFRNIKPTHF